MRALFKPFNLAALAVAVVIAALVSSVAPQQATAATTNFPPSTPVYVIPLQLAKQYTATTANVVRFAIPFKARLVGVSATARASGGTSPTLTVDVLEGGVSVLSAPIAVTAGTVAEGTVTDAALADEALITVSLAITGTSPTWDDITVLLTVVRN